MHLSNRIQLDARYVLARSCDKEGSFEQAKELYSELLNEYPDDLDLLLHFGDILLRKGNLLESLRYLGHAVEKYPASASAHCLLGKIQIQLGQRDEAMFSLYRALEYQPDFDEAHSAIASLSLPYPHYTRILKQFHQWIRPENYVEIGVETGQSMQLAEPPTLCVGVDPEPQISCRFSANTSIISETSNDFFANHDLYNEFGIQTISLAFIDGLHLFEAALKDFISIEQHSSRETIVLVHDCIPLDKATSSRERNTEFWSGDTWKIIPCLKHHRPDLNIITIPSPPTGLAVITCLDPASTVLGNSLDTIMNEYIPLDYDYLGYEKDGILNVVYDDWPSIQDKIGKVKDITYPG